MHLHGGMSNPTSPQDRTVRPNDVEPSPERPEAPDPGAHLAASKRRHNVGNYGYGSDSYSTQGQSMADQNQGYVNQGHFGGHPGGYGHVGGYGSEGGAQSHGTQGWQDSPSLEAREDAQRLQDDANQMRGDKGPTNLQRTDERVRAAVSAALEIHDQVDATHIEVLVKDGEVTLSGTVTDRNQQRLAEEVVAAVSGVRDVQNLIELADPRAGNETARA